MRRFNNCALTLARMGEKTSPPGEMLTQPENQNILSFVLFSVQ